MTYSYLSIDKLLLYLIVFGNNSKIRIKIINSS